MYVYFFFLEKDKFGLVLWTLRTSFCTSRILVIFYFLFIITIFSSFKFFSLNELGILRNKFMDPVKLREEVVPIGLNWWCTRVRQTSHDSDVGVLISPQSSHYIPLGGGAFFFSGTFSGIFLSCDSLTKTHHKKGNLNRLFKWQMK